MFKFISNKFLMMMFVTGLCYTQGRFEISVSIGYSHPLLEAYGGRITINNALDQIFIDGKRIIVSDRLGATKGYSIHSIFKYNFFRQGYLKGVVNVGYNILYNSVDLGKDYDPGVRIQSFSVGGGAEISPIKSGRFYPSVHALLRTNFIGGETFYAAGIDFFKVTPRYGYTAGLSLNYLLKNNLGIFLSYSYSFDNSWGRRTDETTPDDPHTIVFRDKASGTNGLSGDRRIAYWAVSLGMNFLFK